MSAQFGKWNFDGRPVLPEYLEKVGATLAPYGPDSSGSYSKPGLTMLYRGFHTTKESHLEKQPYISPSGAALSWDGRLDNRRDLIAKLYEPWNKPEQRGVWQKKLDQLAKAGKLPSVEHAVAGDKTPVAAVPVELVTAANARRLVIESGFHSASTLPACK